MTILELNIQRSELLLKFDELAKIKKKLYSNMDISLPMSEYEKSLNNELSLIGSKMNAINILKRKLTHTLSGKNIISHQ